MYIYTHTHTHIYIYNSVTFASELLEILEEIFTQCEMHVQIFSHIIVTLLLLSQR